MLHIFHIPLWQSEGFLIPIPPPLDAPSTTWLSLSSYPIVQCSPPNDINICWPDLFFKYVVKWDQWQDSHHNIPGPIHICPRESFGHLRI